MTDSEMVIFLHDQARHEESIKNLRKSQALREIADRLAEVTKKIDMS